MTHDLVITVNPSSLIADLHLYDATGSQLAFHQVAFNYGGINSSEWLGLADLFTYVRHYAPHGQDAAFVASIGVCIA